MAPSTVQAEFHLFGFIKQDGDWYVASCPPLDISTQGRTVQEAKKNLVEASELFLVSCLERGTLDQALRELGFVALKKKGQPVPRQAFPLHVQIPLRFQKNLEWRA